MQAIIIKYTKGNNEHIQYLSGKDLEEEKELHSNICRSMDDYFSFSNWWRAGKFTYDDLLYMQQDEHGLVGWVEIILDDPDCPDWIQDKDFTVEVKVKN
jgi:hypothetical protein